MTEVGRNVVGVMRAVLDFEAEEEAQELESTGSLWVEPPDGELITGRAILYTLDKSRLAEMFDDARGGASNDDLFLALDAAALDDPDHPWSV